MNLENIKLSDMILEVDNGFSIIDVTGIKIENVKLRTKNKIAFEIFNCKNLDVLGLNYDLNSPSSITIKGEESENITLSSSAGNGLKAFTTIGTEVPAGTVKF